MLTAVDSTVEPEVRSAEPVRVVYDASLLGQAERSPMNRTGLFRVSRAIAAGLAARSDCRLWLTVRESLDALDRCLTYLPSDYQLSAVPVLVPPLAGVRRRLFRLLADLQNRAVDASLVRALAAAGQYREAWRHLKPHTRLLRRATSYASHLAGQSPVPDGWERQLDADVYHSPFGPLPPLDGNVARFLTVHDLIPILAPEFCSEPQRAYLRRVLASVKPDDWVLTNSQATKDEFCQFTGMDPARVVVTHLAADPEVFYDTEVWQQELVRWKYELPPGPYFLTLSTLEPRKNLAHLITCFARFVHEQRDSDVSLVLAGPNGWTWEALPDLVATLPEVRDRIVFTGYVNDEDLAALYGGALAFVHVSLREGFGLPPLEAMQCGVPVICSRLAALQEVVCRAGLLVDPRDEDALCEAFHRVSADGSLRARLSRQARARATQFSWTRCLDRTVAAYRAAIC